MRRFAKGIVTGWPGLTARCAKHIEPAPRTAWRRVCQRANGRESGQQEISTETHKDHHHWPHHQTVFGEEDRMYHSNYEYQQHHRAYESCAIIIHPQPKKSSHGVVSHRFEVHRRHPYLFSPNVSIIILSVSLMHFPRFHHLWDFRNPPVLPRQAQFSPLPHPHGNINPSPLIRIWQQTVALFRYQVQAKRGIGINPQKAIQGPRTQSHVLRLLTSGSIVLKSNCLFSYRP